MVPIEPDPLPDDASGAASERYDTIVYGVGTGGVVAGLLVERSRLHRSRELRNDHLRGKRAAIQARTVGLSPSNTNATASALNSLVKPRLDLPGGLSFSINDMDTS